MLVRPGGWDVVVYVGMLLLGWRFQGPSGSIAEFVAPRRDSRGMSILDSRHGDSSS
jgi:hypothetical protein